LRLYGCSRLASRICDLKKIGWRIKKEMVRVACRGGKHAYVARYSMVSK